MFGGDGEMLPLLCKAKLGPSGESVKDANSKSSNQFAVQHKTKKHPQRSAFLFGGDGEILLRLTAKQNLVRQDCPSKTRTHRVPINAPSQQKKSTPIKEYSFFGGDGEIRTLVPG